MRGRFSLRSVASNLGIFALGGLALVLPPGCTVKPEKPAITRYQAMPAKKVPAYMKDTVYERTEVFRIEGLQVSGFGIVANLNGTGESTAPTPVRQHVIKESIKHGVGSKLLPDQRGK